MARPYGPSGVCRAVPSRMQLLGLLIATTLLVLYVLWRIMP